MAIGDDTNVDLDAAGTVLGIELLSPGTPWPLAGVMQQFPQISDEDFRELAAFYPYPPPVVEMT